jgi:hypothetical protein
MKIAHGVGEVLVWETNADIGMRPSFQRTRFFAEHDRAPQHKSLTAVGGFDF